MTIHVVQYGETINSIADKYNVSTDRLMLENGKINTDKLVVGETIVILKPEITYTIQEGDTLSNIADLYEVTVFDLFRNNPYLSTREYIYPGETIVIKYEGNKLRTITTNGYAYPFINMDVLKMTLPFLTYLTVFGYIVTAEGVINDINDTAIIEVAKAYGVAPILSIEALSNSVDEELYIIQSILLSQEIQDYFVDNLIKILRTKGYSGLNFNTPYLTPENRSLYEEFILRLATRIEAEGYLVFDTFTLRVFQLLTGTIFIGLEYSKLIQELDGITLITYSFGYSEGIPPGTLSLDTFRRFWEYAVRLITPEKAFMGIPVNGYVWQLPYIPFKSRGMSVSYDSVLKIAYDQNVEIQFDEITNSAYFVYISENQEFIVRFWDARSIDNYLNIILELGLNGISIWNIMSWFPQIWLIINSMFIIDKVY